MINTDFVDVVGSQFLILIKMKVNKLINQKWIPLLNYQSLKNCKYPGVYILAYTTKELKNKPVKIEDIYYAGMSNSLGGVKQRLSQFISGIERGYGHSAGNRFFRQNKCMAYSRLKKKKNFFVASFSIKCVVEKNKRTPKDLVKMGEVAKFEYKVLAYIKKKLGRESELNKK